MKRKMKRNKDSRILDEFENYLGDNKQKEKEVIEKLVILEELLREGYNVLQKEYDYFFTDEFAKNELIERELEFKENGEKY